MARVTYKSHRPANERFVVALACTHTRQNLFRGAIVACAKPFMMSAPLSFL